MADRTKAIRFCIVGAGAAGLAVAKNFKQRGIPFDCFERETDIGGLWNAETPSGVVYDTAHMVSSRDMTAFDDFPMPSDYPIYPSHRQAMAYLRSYAEEFGILEEIRLGTAVEHIEESNGGWDVRIAGETQPRHYDGVVIANGHHDEPRWPDYPGDFDGALLHSRDYRSPSQLAGKRVLVVGAGNSACDIVNDAIHHADEVMLSVRRGYYILRKYTFGLPTDKVVNMFEAMRLPRWLRQWLYVLAHRIVTGSARRYGLPMPKHWILDSHPTLNSELPSHVGHGRVEVKPDIDSFAGSKVKFVDGSEAEPDLVVLGTGYRISFPFIDDNLLLGPQGSPKLFLNVFHPDKDTLFAAGLIQANGSIWRLADYQAQLISSFIVAKAQDCEQARWFGGLKSAGDRADHRGRYVASERHMLEHDYYAYGRALRKLVKKFGEMARAPYPDSLAETAAKDRRAQELASIGQRRHVA
jgi:cation diffusion facilitator CzcD-associated flavoprotein CzcO